MDALLFRTRVTALWLAVAIAMSASLLLYLFIPGALEEMLAGEMEGETLTDAWGFFLATLVIIPLVMAGVTLLAGDRVNPSVNLIAGLASGLFGVFAVVSELVAGDLNAHVLMAAVAVALGSLIVGLSLAGLRHPTSQPAAPASEPSRPHDATTV